MSAARQCANPKCRRFLRMTWRYTIRNGKRVALRPQKFACSSHCHGMALRGTGKSHIRVRVNGKKVFLHRLIAEEKLGRPLLPEEIVHHVDEVKHNNDPDNLEVLSDNAKAEHLRRHDYYRDKRNSQKVDTSWIDEDMPF